VTFDKSKIDETYVFKINIMYNKNMSKINEFLEDLRVQGARIEVSKLLKLGTNAGEKVMVNIEKVNKVGSFACLGSIVSKNSGCSEDAKK